MRTVCGSSCVSSRYLVFRQATVRRPEAALLLRTVEREPPDLVTVFCTPDTDTAVGRRAGASAATTTNHPRCMSVFEGFYLRSTTWFYSRRKTLSVGIATATFLHVDRSREAGRTTTVRDAA
ncbi:hypothetical protein TGPRC2_294805 [Toxoplasma gondii TgCatPRC2]|uniref:Uncharacterized protein n=12 Tax=Toxoplasma gondii TaxID=5811 RepID=A0A125YN78_TOXGV|nr:hypothetical protein TGME49_294805 [Toxoplasma gondii ME49]EPR57719.1 hypothetical protein TGGT1_294805 [Toxoplasma gondii GT1]ESS29202.1 hypothetical protein TGVEG_294805 [Toxoplasma gondii VEG]KAF4646196.1 hypothetical protein TGRH88_019830 [Toxoplasma gondii]KFG35315.1 hypothetical protein TGP89_294805 [Toxoplasma gondii p89]KFG37330.1 hypothetical protein TGDOM2_294805 [Toxoplasma gondii GAB2-2007-GAL-DOM2]KFG46677.1 hypothetical protein TGFOU_294805 [Toxoplasma gondii FOU]KFH14261.1 |eukprot:XP_018638571.1 hypothetical protein TGME49_294805 [Toxoplasma gondii ME49]